MSILKKLGRASLPCLGFASITLASNALGAKFSCEQAINDFGQFGQEIFKFQEQSDGYNFEFLNIGKPGNQEFERFLKSEFGVNNTVISDYRLSFFIAKHESTACNFSETALPFECSGPSSLNYPSSFGIFTLTDTRTNQELRKEVKFTIASVRSVITTTSSEIFDQKFVELRGLGLDGSYNFKFDLKKCVVNN